MKLGMKTACVTAALLCLVGASASPAHADKGGGDGINECMEAPEGACGNGPFDGMGSGGSVGYGDAATEYFHGVLALWTVVDIIKAGGWDVVTVQKSDGSASDWSAAMDFEDAWAHVSTSGRRITCVPAPGSYMNCAIEP